MSSGRLRVTFAPIIPPVASSTPETDDLAGVLDAITLSRRTYRIIIENFVYAF